MLTSASSSPLLPTLPPEILRLCDPSTLAQTSRVSLASLELSSPLLCHHIDIYGSEQFEMMLCTRVSFFHLGLQSREPRTDELPTCSLPYLLRTRPLNLKYPPSSPSTSLKLSPSRSQGPSSPLTHLPSPSGPLQHSSHSSLPRSPLHLPPLQPLLGDASFRWSPPSPSLRHSRYPGHLSTRRALHRRHTPSSSRPSTA